MSENLRLELIETALLMNASGINSGTSGNLSVRHNDGLLITPSGIKYQRLSPEDIVFVDRDGEAQGSQKPPASGDSTLIFIRADRMHRLFCMLTRLDVRHLAV